MDDNRQPCFCCGLQSWYIGYHSEEHFNYDEQTLNVIKMQITSACTCQTLKADQNAVFNTQSIIVRNARRAGNVEHLQIFWKWDKIHQVINNSILVKSEQCSCTGRCGHFNSFLGKMCVSHHFNETIKFDDVVSDCRCGLSGLLKT